MADDWQSKYEACKVQAQCHAMEARTANATLAAVYQLCTGAKGEPGNWHGAEPVRAALADRDRRIEALTKALRWADDWIGGAPHGDNCYVSNHYEGDPGNQCNCGKESLLEALASAAGAEGEA